MNLTQSQVPKAVLPDCSAILAESAFDYKLKRSLGRLTARTNKADYEELMSRLKSLRSQYPGQAVFFTGDQPEVRALQQAMVDYLGRTYKDGRKVTSEDRHAEMQNNYMHIRTMLSLIPNWQLEKTLPQFPNEISKPAAFERTPNHTPYANAQLSTALRENFKVLLNRSKLFDKKQVSGPDIRSVQPVEATDFAAGLSMIRDLRKTNLDLLEAKELPLWLQLREKELHIMGVLYSAIRHPQQQLPKNLLDEWQKFEGTENTYFSYPQSE